MYKIYQVGINDTLDSIAQRFNTTIEKLRELNGIQSGMTLRPNGFLIVPTGEMQDTNNFQTYIVKSGDNMYAIARDNNVDYQSLLQINGLEPDDYIYPNQEILIPKNNNKIYVTKDSDTITSVSKQLGISPENLKSNEGEVYLLPDQLIIYR